MVDKQVSYRDVVRGKPRGGVVSFARPCFYHFRTENKAADSAAPVKALETPTEQSMMTLVEAPIDVSNFKMGLFMLTVESSHKRQQYVFGVIYISWCCRYQWGRAEVAFHLES